MKRRITMKWRVLSGLVLIVSLVLCVYVPARAGDVSITNNCSQSVSYEFQNNANFGYWANLSTGALKPGGYANVNSANATSCAVLVKLKWTESELYASSIGKWYADTGVKSTIKDMCPIAGCKWLQCGTAAYSFDPVDTPAAPKSGSTRKCVLTTK